MKRYILLFAACMLWWICGCVDDKGNYDYRDLQSLEITGIPEDTVIEQFTHLRIAPEIAVSAGQTDKEVDYLWFLYDWKTQVEETDTLSRDKVLDIEVSIPIGTYSLVFKAIERKTGIFHVRRCSLKVNNSYSEGLLVLSRVNDEANLTFINSTSEPIQNAYFQVNGTVAGKNPKAVKYVSSAFMRSQKTVMLMCEDENGGMIVDPIDLKKVMPLSEMFYLTPKVMRPQYSDINRMSTTHYLVNDGDLYTRSIFQTAAYPPFGAKIRGDYELAPFSFYDAIMSNVLFYDQKHQRFMKMARIEEDNMLTLPDNFSGAFNPNDVGMKMLYGGLFSSTSGRCVMEAEGGQRYLMSFMAMSNNITPSSKIPLTVEGGDQAQFFTVSDMMPSYVYYAVGNRIFCVSFTTGNKMSDYDDFPAGSVVDFIKCDRVNNVDEMWVGISDGSGRANSGSVYVLKVQTDGSLTEVWHKSNICGQVVDFDYKY